MGSAQAMVTLTNEKGRQNLSRVVKILCQLAEKEMGKMGQPVSWAISTNLKDGTPNLKGGIGMLSNNRSVDQ